MEVVHRRILILHVLLLAAKANGECLQSFSDCIDTQGRFYRYFTVKWKTSNGYGALIEINVGRPRSTFFVQLRLDSDYIWVYDDSCLGSDLCGDVRNKPLFNRRLSASCRDLNRPSALSQTVVGDVVDEEIGLQQYLTLRHEVGLAQSQLDKSFKPHGMLGLGPSSREASPLLHFLRHVSAPQFTIMAENVDKRNEEGPIGYLTFGDIDRINCGNDWRSVAARNNTRWDFIVNLATVGKHVDDTSYVAEIDPSSQYTLAPRQFIQALYGVVNAKPTPNNTLYAVDAVGSVALTPITLRIGTHNLEWKPQHYLLPPSKESGANQRIISLIHNPREGVFGQPTWVLGNDFLRQYCVSFLHSNGNQISFATNIWKPGTIQNQNSAWTPTTLTAQSFLIILLSQIIS